MNKRVNCDNERMESCMVEVDYCDKCKSMGKYFNRGNPEKCLKKKAEAEKNNPDKTPWYKLPAGQSVGKE